MTQLCFMDIPAAPNPERVEITRRINPNNIGYSDHPLFPIYHGMRARCTNQNQKNYRFYGAIGIKVCHEWMDGIPAFLRDMGASWPGPGHELDRIDPNGDYCKENCRWIPKRENVARANRARFGAKYKKRYYRS